LNIQKIDGNMLKKMIIAGANELNRHRQAIDALNVFPVPDGDTGTNMSYTLLAAAREAAKLENPTVYEVAKAASDGSLRGARGNSGVILSQLFRGFAKGLLGKEFAEAADIADAFVKGYETAFKAVMKPREGTILTVAREIGVKARECADNSLELSDMMDETMAHGYAVLDDTPNMLAVLKQAGVVDAGGKGLLLVIEGAIASVDIVGDILVDEYDKSSSASVSAAAVSDEHIEFGYCTEFIVNIQTASEMLENRVKSYLETVGDSIVVVADGNIMKVHVHTENPGLVLEYAIKEGTLSNIKIENMREQHEELSGQNNVVFANNPTPPETRKEIGFVAVVAGSGLQEIFKSLGVDVIVDGGQTMNPSAEDIAIAAQKANADEVIILPNNKNIILAAKQAVKLCKEQKLHVVPSETIPQGISAIISYTAGMSGEENAEQMFDAAGIVKTGQITHAVRATTVNDIEIEEGDFLCIFENEIIATQKELDNAAKELIEKMLETGDEYVTIYHGADAKEENAAQIAEHINTKYPNITIDVQNGAQPVYYYIVSVE
jgi:DAK2 domain fusion protein YloV